MTLPILRSFPPSAAGDARVLILGSMPGRESLRLRQYYAHPGNAFWRIMGDLVGFDPALPYGERLERLRDGGVALWDVIATCRREGSLDSRIRDAAPNDLPRLLGRCPSIRLVACNGAASYDALAHFFPALPVRAVRLPSTSPAAATLTYADKARAWREALAPCLRKPRQSRDA